MAASRAATVTASASSLLIPRRSISMGGWESGVGNREAGRILRFPVPDFRFPSRGTNPSPRHDQPHRPRHHHHFAVAANRHHFSGAAAREPDPLAGRERGGGTG